MLTYGAGCDVERGGRGRTRNVPTGFTDRAKFIR